MTANGRKRDRARAPDVRAALGELEAAFRSAPPDAAEQRAALPPGLVGALLRLVFLLHAEARGLLPAGSPSPTALYERLEDDEARFPGALEARSGVGTEIFSGFGFAAAPRVPDGAVFRALRRLLFVGNARISYETLDIEHMGRAYELALGAAERRRSGSHYTPREISAPIVEKTLAPLFAPLLAKPGGPRAADILALRVCDPAMGSGAFLLAACEALSVALIAAWRRWPEEAPRCGPGEDEARRAMQSVARHCLYGVDQDPLAVELGRLSLWLATSTSAGEEPHSFLNQRLQIGDALLGFDWQGAFPDVFSKERGGFDAFVGNPPFLGGSKISSVLGKPYLARLLRKHEGAHGNGDLAAHFFRRAFDLLRPGGTMGFVATNTIAQGDTRATGLGWICEHGGAIYDAERRRAWRGDAAVVVSAVHIEKGKPTLPPRLDGRPVERISAFLRGNRDDRPPLVLAANAGLCFLGSKIYGQGFVFDDEDEAATPLAAMRALVEKDPRYAARILPYIGGEELNTSPTQENRRWVIHFGQMSEEEARGFPDLLRIVEEKVKPARLLQKRKSRARYWWRFGETSPALYEAIRRLPYVFAASQVSGHLCLAKQPVGRIFAHTLNVFAFSSYAAFAVLQSRLHEAWARQLGSSMKDDLRYTASDCFETFPFPFPSGLEDEALARIGRAYEEQRAAWMLQKGEGLTKTYNRFHDPDERSPGIEALRELHAVMDRAVLDRYEFCDIVPAHDFRERPDGSRRFGWDDATRDEVLSRLFERNRERAREAASVD